MPQLIPVNYCPHNSGVVIDNNDVRCEDCHTVMVWIARDDLERLRRPPSEKEQQLLEQLQHEETHLRSIYALLGNILMSRGHL